MAIGVLWCCMAVGPAHAILPDARTDSAPSAIARQESVGGTNLSFPNIQGFQEVLGRSAEFDRFMEKFVPADYRLLAFYMSDEDMDNMSREKNQAFRKYVIVQSLKKSIFLENPAVFSTIKQSFREEMSAQDGKPLPGVSDVMSGVSEYLDSQYSADMKMQIGQTNNMGVFTESNTHIGFLTLSNLGVETPDGRKDYPTAVATMAVNLRGRLVFIYTYFSNYQALTDIEFVRVTAKHYVDMLEKVNSDNRSAEIWQKLIVGSLGLMGALVAAVLLMNRSRNTPKDSAA